MLRLLSEKEKNRSWVPFDNFFMTKEEYENFLKQSRPYDSPVEIVKTDLSDNSARTRPGWDKVPEK